MYAWPDSMIAKIIFLLNKDYYICISANHKPWHQRRAIRKLAPALRQHQRSRDAAQGHKTPLQIQRRQPRRDVGAHAVQLQWQA